MKPIKIFLFILIIVVSGCAVAPVQEMSDARQAIEAALEVGAGSLASEEMKQAEALLAQAEAALAERNYRLAREQAAEARKLAVIAQKKALNQ